MADVYNYVISTGTVTTDTGVILTEVQDEYKSTFGQDLIVTPETPQGALIVSETLARVAVADNNAALANQINPNIAGGVFLDAILALTGVQRTPATPSTVLATVTGVPGTLIPAGSQASETGSGNANLFQTITSVTIPISGSLDNVQFQSVVDGPIPAAANTLTQIVSDVLGWETVTNPAAATPGQDTQSDISARAFRRETLFSQGLSLAGSITSALYQVDGVTSLTFRENIANTTQVIDGITMVAHSIYVCVDGGVDDAVAKAIQSKKSAGSNYNNGASGNPKSIPVTDPFSGQTINVLFDRPDEIEIIVQATVSATTSVQNPQAAVVKAILDYAAGLLDGEPGLTVGTSVSSFELAGACNREAPGIFVHNMEIKKVGGSFSSAEIAINLWEIAQILEGSITVIIV